MTGILKRWTGYQNTYVDNLDKSTVCQDIMIDNLQVKIFEFYPSGRTPVERTESEFSVAGWPNRWKILERNFTHNWYKVPKCQGGTLHSVEYYPGTMELCTSGS